MCPCGKKGAQQCHRGEKAPGFSWIVGGAEGAASVQCGQHQAQQDLINTHKYLRGRNEDEGVRLFAVLPPDRTRGNGHKLEHMKFHKKIPVGVVKHRSKFPEKSWNVCLWRYLKPNCT